MNGTRTPRRRSRRPSAVVGRVDRRQDGGDGWAGSEPFVDSVMAGVPSNAIVGRVSHAPSRSRGSGFVPSWAHAATVPRCRRHPTLLPRKEAHHGKARPPATRPPTFTLPDQDGKPVSLKDFAGQPGGRVLLPEGRHARAAPKRPASSTTTCGPSHGPRWPSSASPADGAEKHQKFRSKYGLKFPLLTDADHKVGEAYGAWGEKTLYGKKSIGVIRSTFLIGAGRHHRPALVPREGRRPRRPRSWPN